jgi:hypothetical protein
LIVEKKLFGTLTKSIIPVTERKPRRKPVCRYYGKTGKVPGTLFDKTENFCTSKNQIKKKPRQARSYRGPELILPYFFRR